MIPLFKVNMSGKAEDAVADVLRSGNVTIGPRVDEFEEKLQAAFGLDRPPITTNSATSAIDLALELCGVGPGDEVISTPQTCFASNIGAIHRGAKIRWADIDRVTGLIDPESVEKLITKKTKAIIAVNWAGVPADYAKLKSFYVPVIEDAAHSLDTFEESLNRERGDYVVYSFQAIKFLTSGDGGMLITPPEREHEARLLRWYGLDRTIGQSFRLTQDVQVAGFKYNMNDIAAAVGIANLDTASDAVMAHRDNAFDYIEAFRDLDFLRTPEFRQDASYWIYPVVLGPRASRDKFNTYLNEHGISTNMVHYRNDSYSSTSQFTEGRLPGVDYFTDYQTNIPVGWWLLPDDKEHIIETVRNFKP